MEEAILDEGYFDKVIDLGYTQLSSKIELRLRGSQFAHAATAKLFKFSCCGVGVASHKLRALLDQVELLNSSRYNYWEAFNMKPGKDRPLEEDLDILLEKSRRKSALPIQEILEILSGKGRFLILIFLSLPFCQPLQIPGLSTPFGIMIAFIGLRMAFGKRIWLPKKILLKRIRSTVIEKATEKSLRMMNKMRRFIHPRLAWLSDHVFMKVVNGLLIVLLGLFLALPLPIPLTNLAAGWAIFLVSLGLLENDGVFVIIGYLVSLITVAFFVLMLFSIKLVV